MFIRKLYKSCADMQPIPIDSFFVCLLNNCDANDDGICSRNFARIFVCCVFIYCSSLFNHHHLRKYHNLKNKKTYVNKKKNREKEYVN